MAYDTISLFKRSSCSAALNACSTDVTVGPDISSVEQLAHI